MKIHAALSLAFVLAACADAPAQPPSAAPPSPAASTPGVAATPVTGAQAASPAAVAATTDLIVGQPAPDFSTTDQDGKPLHLADLKGHYVVVYFYPKDETPGCTHEACSFRDSWAKLQKSGVVVIGVSMDTQKSHKDFATNHQLPFTLVSDPKGEIGAKYGVPADEGYEKRQSFVVGPDGNVKKIYRKVDVQKHADEILADTQP